MSVSGPGDWGFSEGFAGAASNLKADPPVTQFLPLFASDMSVIAKLTGISFLTAVTSIWLPVTQSGGR